MTWGLLQGDWIVEYAQRTGSTWHEFGREYQKLAMVLRSTRDRELLVPCHAIAWATTTYRRGEVVRGRVEAGEFVRDRRRSYA